MHENNWYETIDNKTNSLIFVDEATADDQLITVAKKRINDYINDGRMQINITDKTPELIENCSFIDCGGTGEYSGGIGLSHSNVIIRRG